MEQKNENRPILLGNKPDEIYMDIIKKELKNKDEVTIRAFGWGKTKLNRIAVELSSHGIGFVKSKVTKKIESECIDLVLARVVTAPTLPTKNENLPTLEEKAKLDGKPA